MKNELNIGDLAGRMILLTLLVIAVTISFVIQHMTEAQEIQSEITPEMIEAGRLEGEAMQFMNMSGEAITEALNEGK